MPLLLSLSLLLTSPARAADWPDLSTPPPAPGSAANDAALVVGIEDYAFAQDIPGARDNALSWVRWLQARKVTLVKPLLDQQATREELLSSAAQVAAKVKPGGTLWLVYIGHGAPSRTEDDGLLVGVDAQQTSSSLQARGLSQRELVAAIEGALPSGAQAVLVLDACFSGKTASGDLAPGLAPLNPVSARLSSGRVTALTAARSDEYAGPLPDGRRPAFSYLVLGALRGWGDGDGDGRVSAQEAVSYAGDAMLQTVTGRSQTPTLSGDGSLVLGSGAEVGPDLVELSVAARTARADGVTATINLGSGSMDFAELTARAQAAELLKRQAEAAAEAAAAALAAEERRRLDAAAAAARAQASRDFAALEALVESPTQSGKPVLEAYLAKYGAATVTVGPRSEPVTVPEVARVRAALAVVAAPATAGTPVQTALTGRAGEQLVTESGMKMRVIPAGTFTMGCTPGAGECEDDEKPAHKVTLTRSFLLGETEVTQGQWMAVMGSNPSRFSSCGSDCPVENVSWLDAVAFANALSKKEGLEACYAVSGEAVSWRKGAACTGYRLPTEAEWEYAARAGRDSLYAGGDELGAVGWFTDNAGGTTHRVAQKGANDWGLFDVTGNVWEWNWDRYGAYPTGTVSDPAGASDGLGRVARGGSWLDSARSARLAYRDGDLPGYRISVLGLRLARSLP